MADHDPNIGAAPEPSVAGFSDSETIDLLESWLQGDPDIRFGKARADGERLGLQVTRRRFSEAKRRIGITASTAPHPDHRRAVEVHNAKPDVPTGTPPAAVAIPTLPEPERRVRPRRSRRPIALAGLSSLAENLEALVAERDRARAALEEIRRIVKALR